MNYKGQPRQSHTLVFTLIFPSDHAMENSTHGQSHNHAGLQSHCIHHSNGSRIWGKRAGALPKIHGQFQNMFLQISGTYTKRNKYHTCIKDQLPDPCFPFFAAINSSTDVSCEWIFIILVLNDRYASRK
jgi:hypothetical protein